MVIKKNIVYLGTQDDIDGNSMTTDHYNLCSGCNKVCCVDCILDDNDNVTIEYFPNPEKNKFWCKSCYNFHKQMKQLK